MIVDSHLHLFRNGYDFGAARSPLEGVCDIDAYEEQRGLFKIEAGLVVCYEGAGIDPENNAYVRDLAKDRTWIFSTAYTRPETLPGRGAIESLLDAGHCGIALYLPDAAAALALREWPRESWDCLSRARAVVSLNASPEASAQLRPTLQAAPGCSFLFSHLGLPGKHREPPATTIARERLGPLIVNADLPNVGVKLSGLYAIDPHPPHGSATPFFDVLLESFGPARLHWGSDFSPALEFVTFTEAFQLACIGSLSSAERELVMGEGLMEKLRGVRG